MLGAGSGSRLWELWANNPESRLNLNHVPVHETHSAKVGKITTTSKTPSLNRMVAVNLNFKLWNQCHMGYMIRGFPHTTRKAKKKLAHSQNYFIWWQFIRRKL
jgi:hypothetical protein